MTPANRIVAAACKTTGGLIVVGVRHYDEIMQSQAIAANQKINYKEQGFIDNRGNYLDRKAALKLATENEQVGKFRQKTHPFNVLFSEDIY